MKTAHKFSASATALLTAGVIALAGLAGSANAKSRLDTRIDAVIANGPALNEKGRAEVARLVAKAEAQRGWLGEAERASLVTKVEAQLSQLNEAERARFVAMIDARIDADIESARAESEDLNFFGYVNSKECAKDAGFRHLSAIRHINNLPDTYTHTRVADAAVPADLMDRCVIVQTLQSNEQKEGQKSIDGFDVVFYKDNTADINTANNKYAIEMVPSFRFPVPDFFLSSGSVGANTVLDSIVETIGKELKKWSLAGLVKVKVISNSTAGASYLARQIANAAPALKITESVGSTSEVGYSGIELQCLPSPSLPGTPSNCLRELIRTETASLTEVEQVSRLDARDAAIESAKTKSHE